MLEKSSHFPVNFTINAATHLQEMHPPIKEGSGSIERKFKLNATTSSTSVCMLTDFKRIKACRLYLLLLEIPFSSCFSFCQSN